MTIVPIVCWTLKAHCLAPQTTPNSLSDMVPTSSISLDSPNLTLNSCRSLAKTQMSSKFGLFFPVPVFSPE